jgi:hypothetical protein
MHLTRQQAHSKIDDVFDSLEQIEGRKGNTVELHQLLLKVCDDDAVTGCILAKRTHPEELPYVTWGIAPYDKGLHSGHYDMGFASAREDWIRRIDRGW